MDNRTPIPATIYKYENGTSLVMELYESFGGASEREATADWLVETLSKDELKKYIADMLYGIEVIKNKERIGRIFRN